MERKDIAEQYKWNVSDIYPSDDAWEQEFSETEKECSFSEYKGKLGSVEVLLEYNKKKDALMLKLNKLYCYSSMRHDEDVREAKYVAMNSRMEMLVSKLMTELAFEEPELISLPEETLKSFASDPRLSDYDYSLKRLIAEKEHVLSEAEERILALSSEATNGYSDVFAMLDNADLDLPEAEFNGEKIRMTHGMYGVVLHGGTREEREEWFKKYYNAYIKIGNTLTAAYSGNVKKDVYFQRARKYNSCLERSLSSSDVPTSVYENLIKTVHDALPVMHRYISLRKRILGLEEQHMYDIYVPLVENSDIKLPYDEAYELVIKGLAVLGKDYQNLLKKAHDERWIDVYENEGKRSGAYSTGGVGNASFCPFELSGDDKRDIYYRSRDGAFDSHL